MGIFCPAEESQQVSILGLLHAYGPEVQVQHHLVLVTGNPYVQTTVRC